MSVLNGYQKSWLRGDVVAGITVAAIAIPESLGYAKIAGLPIQTGLYCALLPALMFALIGSSRQLVVGADSATAALVAAGAGLVAAQGTCGVGDLLVEPAGRVRPGDSWAGDDQTQGETRAHQGDPAGRAPVPAHCAARSRHRTPLPSGRSLAVRVNVTADPGRPSLLRRCRPDSPARPARSGSAVR